MFGRKKNSDVAPPADPSAAIAQNRFAPKSASESLKPTSVPPPPPRIRRPRGGLLSMLSGFLTFGLVLAGTAVGGLLVLEHEVDQPGPLAADRTVLIPKGSGTGEITDLLAKEGVIASPTLFELYAYLNRRKGQLKAGEFLFPAGANIEGVVDILTGGKAILHAITLPEGLTSEQVMQRLRESDVLVGEVNETPREGSLLPDTYKVERGTSRQQVVNLMQSAQRQALAQTWAKRSPDIGIKTPQELIILASIVERETGRADERPRVASVFLNRLQRRMKLQSDPTIVYGLVGGKGTLGRGITRSEIDRATPYNTYVIEGLPPGPIANPGRAALEAVANPLKTKDIYFVADGTGGHAFAETLDQHGRNVLRWRQIERSRETAGANAPVDRAEPPPGPETRTEIDPLRPPADYAGLAAGGEAPRARFDASEGTSKDPLLNQSWDLTSAKTVPSFGPPSTAGATKREAARAGAKRSAARSRE